MGRILLLSYPRSGNSLIKYFLKRSLLIDTVHDCRYQKAYKNNKNISNEWVKNQNDIGNTLYKEHYAKYCKNFSEEEDSLILILRNYKECIVRHNKQSALNNQKVREENCKKYLSNIGFYDKWGGKKVVLYYEDLIYNFKKHYRKILKIVDVNKEKHEEMFNNLEEHKKLCLKQYDKVCGSQSLGTKKFYHSKNISSYLKLEFDSYIKRNKLHTKYLSRYLEKSGQIKETVLQSQEIHENTTFVRTNLNIRVPNKKLYTNINDKTVPKKIK